MSARDELTSAYLACLKGQIPSEYETTRLLGRALTELRTLEQKLAEQQLDDIRRFGT